VPSVLRDEGFEVRIYTLVYLVRRRWDYFVKHLLGAEPPKE
jgi:hypothetical protein